MPAELSVDVPRGTHAPALARGLVQSRFGEELPAQQLDDLLVIVSELTTNAALYGVGEIRLRVSVDDGRVYGEVVDEGVGFVREVRDRGIDEVGQKGLMIVAMLAERWGIHEGTSHVWFEVASGDESQAAAPRLATRRPPCQLDA